MLIDTDMDAVGRQDFRRSLGEHIALDAAVVADGNGLGAALGLDPVGKALGRLAHNINVHTVGARADHAAQTRRAEFQRDRKAILNGSVILTDSFQFRFEVRIIQVGC